MDGLGEGGREEGRESGRERTPSFCKKGRKEEREKERKCKGTVTRTQTDPGRCVKRVLDATQRNPPIRLAVVVQRMAGTIRTRALAASLGPT